MVQVVAGEDPIRRAFARWEFARCGFARPGFTLAGCGFLMESGFGQAEGVFERIDGRPRAGRDERAVVGNFLPGVSKEEL